MDSKIKITGSLTAFIILAGISCWATEKSLQMLLPAEWPELAIWGITIAFFIVASIGTKLIVDVLSYPGFIDNRRLKFFGGILLVIFFWLLMSMPTNTHTFFYKDQIGKEITKDIETTNKYLQQIIDKGSGSTIVLDSTGKEIKNFAEEERRHIVAQFNGDEPPYKKGNGVEIGKHLENINKVLGSSIQQDSKYNSQDPQILIQYHYQIDKALESALKPHTISDKSLRNARTYKQRLEAMNDSIQDALSTDHISDEEIKQVEKLLSDGYNLISTNSKFIHFDNQEDKELYTNENGITRTKRLSSVIDVFFVDFLQGKYPGSFWYYVILSILIDVAAFIFFDIVFRRQDEDYNI